jgi:hypothetical protein
MTHTELVARAVAWLKNSMKCLVVLSEQGGGLTYEKPDAIGWAQGKSILVECKASIADLRADFSKPSRKYPDLSIGSQKFYMVAKELEAEARVVLRGAKMDEWNGWGLLICHPTMIKEAWGGFGARLSALGKQYEDAMLLATLERIAWRINPMTISEFLRLTPTQMRAVELQDEQPQGDNASTMADGQGPVIQQTTAEGTCR